MYSDILNPITARLWHQVLTWQWIKWALMLAIISAAGVGLVTGVPVRYYPVYGDQALAFFRMIFSAVLLLRLIRSQQALPMLWGWQQTTVLKRIWLIWMVNTFFLMTGFFSQLAALLNFILFLLVFTRSRYFSIEEIYFQITSFILIFLPVNQVWSVDSWLAGQTEIYLRDNFFQSSLIGSADTVVVLNAYAWLLALLLLSAAYEKISVGNWRKGLSFYYFIGLPHLVKPRFHFLRRYRWLCVCASYMTVVGQGAMGIAYFIPGVREAFLIKQIMFGLLLFVIVDISFIGQLFALQFIVLLVFCQAESSMAIPEYNPWLIVFMLAVITGAALVVFEIMNRIVQPQNAKTMQTERYTSKQQSEKLKTLKQQGLKQENLQQGLRQDLQQDLQQNLQQDLQQRPQRMGRVRIDSARIECLYNWVKRWVTLTSGLMPVRVFSDVHLFGLYVYKIELYDTAEKGAERKKILSAFTENGEPGPMQNWHPRYYQGAMYPVTDACLARRYFTHLQDYKRAQLDDLLFAALSSVHTQQRNTLYAILSVKAVNPTQDYRQNTQSWIDSHWTAVYRCKMVTDGILKSEWLSLPPPVDRITRELP